MKWEVGKTYAWKDVKDANQFFKWYDVDYLKYLRLPFKVASVDAKKGYVRSVYLHDGTYMSSTDVGLSCWFLDHDRSRFEEISIPEESKLIDLLKLAMDNYKIRFECKSHAAIGANALRHISSFEELKDFLDKMPERVQAIQEAEKALNELDKIG